jgi:nucleoside permease NupC
LLVSSFFDSAKDAVVLNIDLNNLTLGGILGGIFHYAALLMGVPLQDATAVGGLMGTKLVINEFVAYSQMTELIESNILAQKSVIIATFALCGFANLGAVAIMIGGLGELAPTRKHDLARLGLKAMFCGTLASYLSASIAGILFIDPADTADTSIVLPVVIILISSGVILAFNMATRHPEKMPALLVRLSRQH